MSHSGLPKFFFRIEGHPRPPFTENIRTIVFDSLPYTSRTSYTASKQPEIFRAKCFCESQLSIRTGSAAATQFETFAPSRQTHNLVIWVISTGSQKGKNFKT